MCTVIITCLLHDNTVESRSYNDSDAHFRRSPVIDRLKFQTTDCSNPHQDFGPIEAQFWSSRVPFFYDTVNKPAIVFPPNASLSSAQNRRVDKKKNVHKTAGAQCFSWSKLPGIVHGQSALCFAGFNSWSKSKFMIRNHSPAAVPGLIIVDVNFNLSCFVHNHWFCFL